MSEELVDLPIPPLVTILADYERRKGSPLTREEVIDLRDRAVCMALPASVAAQMAASRGFDDVRLDHVWEDWIAIRPSLGLQTT